MADGLLGPGGVLDPATPVAGLGLLEDIETPGFLKRGFGVGMAGTKASLYGAGALAARGVGAIAPAPVAAVASDVERAALANVEAQNRIAAEGVSPLEQVDWTSPTSIVNQFKYYLGAAAPTLALMAAGGAIGGGLGALAKRGAATTRLGALTGAVTPDIAIEAGSIFPEALKTGVENPALRALAGGAVAGAIDFIPFLAAEKYLRPLGKGGFGALAKGALKGAPVGAALEGSQELLQAVIERAAAGKSLTDPEAITEYMESFAGGASPGLLFGAGIGARRGAKAPVQETPPPTTPEQPSVADTTVQDVGASAQVPTVGNIEAPPASIMGDLEAQHITAQQAALTADQKVSALEIAIAPLGKRVPQAMRTAYKTALVEQNTARVAVDELATQSYTLRQQLPVTPPEAALPEIGVTPEAPRVPPVSPPLTPEQGLAAADVTPPKADSIWAATEIRKAREVDPTITPDAALDSLIAHLPEVEQAAVKERIKEDTIQRTQAFLREQGPVNLPPTEADKQQSRIVGATQEDIAALIQAKVDNQPKNAKRKIDVAATTATVTDAVNTAVERALKLPTIGAQQEAIKRWVPKALVGKINSVDAKQFAKNLAEKVSTGTLYSKGAQDGFLSGPVPDHLASQIREAGGDPATITIIKDRAQLRDFQGRYGLANALIGAKGQIFGRTSRMFVDDDQNGKPVGVVIELEQQPNAAPTPKPTREEVHTAMLEWRKAVKTGDQKVIDEKFNAWRELRHREQGIPSRAALTPDEFDNLPEPAKFAAVEEINRVWREKGTALRQRLVQLVGDRPELVVKTFMATPDSPIGSYTRVNPLKSVISLALNAKDGLGLADHEGFHYAEDWLLTSSERQIIGNALKEGRPLRQQLLSRVRAYDQANNTNITDEVSVIPAEARAYAFEFWRRGELQVEGRLSAIWQKISNFLERIANLVRGLGFVSIEDVFTALDRGQFAERTANTESALEQERLASESRRQEWYRSALADAITAMPTKVASAQGWKDQIKGLVGKNDVKQVEIDAVGLNDWLDLQQGKVTKDQVTAFLGQNGVRVEETVLSDDDKEEDFNSVIGQDSTKFSGYQLPGGKNYRELLLRLPSRDYSRIAIASARVAEIDNIAAGGDLRQDRILAPERRALMDELRNLREGQSDFRFSHFDQPNILAHIRFNERTDAEGKRVLFIEEIQSDWAQKGKKEGFGAPQPFMNFTDWIANNYPATSAEEKERLWNERSGPVWAQWRRFADANARSSQFLPTAPFVTKTEAWVALSLKRMIRYAAENGFDKVAWTNGEQQADRYDLSKQVDEIRVGHNEHGYWMQATPKDSDQLITKNALTKSTLEDHVGKNIAARAIRDLEDTAHGVYTTFKGVDLKVGGEGMKAFYDKIVPNVANDVLKKLGGGRVGEIQMGSLTSDERKTLRDLREINDPNAVQFGERARLTEKEKGTQPGFTITPQLADRVASGVPLFSHGAQDQTQTPEFKRWFGKSKVVDAEGRPLVVYKAMQGFTPHMMTNTGMTHVATVYQEAERWQAQGRPVQDVYVRATKPFDFRVSADLAWLTNEMRKPANVAAFNKQTKELMGIDYSHVADARYIRGSLEIGAYQTYEIPVVSSLIKNRGYDAIYMIEEGQNPRNPNLAVFNREQIKSATGNTGAFDPTNPDIRYSKGALEGIPPVYTEQAFREMAAQYAAGELPQMQFFDAVAKMQDQARSQIPETKSMLKSTGKEMVGAFQRARTYISTGNYIAKSSKGFKNVMRPLYAQEQYKDRLIVDGSEVGLSTWHTATQEDRVVTFDALMKRNIGGFLKGSKEFNDLYSSLETPARKAMFEQVSGNAAAEGIIAKFLQMEFEAETNAFQRIMTAPEFEQWQKERGDSVRGLIESGYIPERRYGDHTVALIVDVQNPDGSTRPVHVAFERFQTAAFAAVRVQQYQTEIERTGATVRVEQGFMHSTERDTDLSIQQVLDLTRRQGIRLQQAEIEKLSRALLAADSMRRNRLMRREHVPGMSKNGWRVLNEWVTGMSGRIAHSTFSDAVNSSLDGKPVEAFIDADGKPVISIHEGNLWKDDGPRSGFYRNLADERADFVLTPGKGSAISTRLRTAAMSYFLGGSLGAGVVQMFAVPMNTLPYLSQHTPYTNAFSTTLASWGYTLRNSGVLRDINALKNPDIIIPGLTPELRQALIQAAQDGTNSSTEIHQIMGISRGGMLAQSRTVQRAMDIWMAPFKFGENTSRVASFIAAWKIATTGEGVALKQADGTYAAPRTLADRELYEFAKNAVDETQNRYDPVNRPAIAHHPIGALLFMFKSFPLFVVEMIETMFKQNPKSAVYMLLGLVALTGVQGLPFAEDILDIIDVVSQKIFGSPFQTRRAMRNMIKDASEAMVGVDLSNLVMRGMINDLTDLNIATRVGNGDLIPGTRLGAADMDYGRLAEQFLGAPVSMVVAAGGQVPKFVGGMFKGDFDQMFAALRAGGPVTVRNAIKGYEQAATGFALDARGQNVVEVSGPLAMFQSVGVSPGAVTKAYDLDAMDKQRNAFYKQVSTDIQHQLVQAIRDGDSSKAQEVYEAVTAWNEANLGMPLMPNPAAVRRAIVRAGMLLNARTLMLMPRALRGSSVAGE